MKFYLSSYELGDEPEKFVALFGSDKRVGYIPNARDYKGGDPDRRARRTESDIAGLRGLGLAPDLLDLREYFGDPAGLRARIASLGGFWVSGGNTFVLRQAMRLSWLDRILRDMDRSDFVYGGYSAAGCVLSENLQPYSIVDDPENFPYSDIRETIWEGLGFIPYAFQPHYRSDHPESAGVEIEVERCIARKIPFVALRDGEAIIIDHVPARDLPRYRHYKGGEYEFVGHARSSDDLAALVVYRALYDSDEFGTNALWVRRRDEFEEMITIDGARIPRFERMGE